MAELISKQQVCEVLAQFAPENYTQLVEMLVIKLPAVDAVEVVRCKDCEHRKKLRYDGQYHCCNEDAGMAYGVELNDDDFCSYGERRGENAAD